MDCQECTGNCNQRQCRCGYDSSEISCSSSRSGPRNEIDTSCAEEDNYNQDAISKRTTAAAATAPIRNDEEDTHRRSTRIRRPSLTIATSSYKLHHHFLLVIILLNSLTLTQQQGITFGGVLNLDRCYSAMQNAQTDQTISRSQYATFIQELANNQFQSFRFDAETNTYGNFPTTDFNSFPEQIRQEFNKHACGGENFICEQAYLYTEGTAPNDPLPDPQTEVYLYQVCEGVESAIEETLPKTEKPTDSPTSSAPTVAPSPAVNVVEETVLLNYQITVPSFITEGGFQNGDNDESEELKEALLTAVQAWTQEKASELSREGGGDVFERKKKHGRNLAVTIDLEKVQFTNVTSADCITEPAQFRDKCLDIQMAVPLQLTGNQSLTPEGIKGTIELMFEEALKDGSFYDSLPAEVRDYISGISAPNIVEVPLSPPPTAQATVVAPTPPQESFNPQTPSTDSIRAPEPAPAPSPDEGGDSSIIRIAAGVSAGLVVIIAGFFVFRRRQSQKRRFDNTDSTPSFGKRASNDSAPKGLFSAFAPKRKDVQSDDLEWGQDQSSDDSGSMQSYSSHSSSGSNSSSYYSSSGSSSRSGGPASVSASSASSYDTHPDDPGRPVTNSMTSGKSSSSSEKGMTSVKSSSSSEKDTTNQLYDLNDSEGSKSEASDGAKGDKAILAPDYLQAQDRADANADDDSSAGSSGWESSDGDSSVQTGSVDSFDPNTESLGTSVSPSHDGTSAYSEGEMEDRELMPESLNPAVNPVVQRGVTMIPVNEDEDEEDSDSTSDDSDAPARNREDVAPMAQDLDRAIEAGDWAAVGATAAILASDSDRDDDSAIRSTGVSTKSGSHFSSAASVSTGTEYTDDSGLDAARAAEIDQLVESGNWDGVVAVAARYADDASMTSSARKPSIGGDDEHHSDASASVESARSIVTGTTNFSNKSGTDSSRSTLQSGEPSNSVASSAESPKGSSGATPEDDIVTHASSITSSYVSRSGISSSMVSNTSSLSNEKQQMNMYRAEVEALVRRVVPDEIDNIDDIMVQFSGREEELIETLKAMQEKSIAQRARAAVQRTAKREKGVLGRSSPDDDDSLSQEVSIAMQTISSDGKSSKASSNYSSAYTSSGAGDSITEDFAGMSRGSMYSDASSYLSREDNTRSVDSGYSTYSGEGSGHSDERTMEDSYVTTEHNDDGTGASSLSGAVDASDWRAMGTPAEMLGEKSSHSGKDPLDDLLRGGPSEADRASGRYRVDS